MDPLQVASRLRTLLSPELAREAAALLDLRRRARERLPRAAELDLHRQGLEQATDQRVSRVRARRIAAWIRDQAPRAWVLDATAGIGGDSMVLLEEGVARLVAADRVPRTLAALVHNLSRIDPCARVVCMDASRPALRPDFVLLDPDRRASGRRSGEPERWSPAWQEVLRWLRSVRGACVKLAPAVDVDRLELPADLPRSFEWTSLRGELKEVALWTGELAREAREITVVRRDGEAITWSASPTPVPALDERAAHAVRWIHDPDPTVVRSGLLGALARIERLSPLAPDLAYLGGEHASRSAFLRAYRVLGSAPLDRRRVRELLQRHDVGPLVVKKRGHPDDAATLARRLRGRGSKQGLLLVARLLEAHRAYLVRSCREVDPARTSE